MLPNGSGGCQSWSGTPPGISTCAATAPDRHCRSFVATSHRLMGIPFAEFIAAQSRNRNWAAVPLEQPVSVDDLPTPALVVDVAAMERNLAHMADFLARRKVGLRPHFKMHKCPVIAERQFALGAVGICAAKLAEAEVLCSAGMGRILVTSPVVTDDKLNRAVQLAAACEDFRIVVDDAAAARRLGSLATAAGIDVSVLIDLDPDMGRTGIARGAPALALANTIIETPGLRFSGLQQYAGNVMHEHDFETRTRRSREIMAQGLETRRLLESAGIAVDVFTGGGTGTFDIDSAIDGVTDIQAGSYVFMDRQYAALQHGNAAQFDVFEPALFVLVTAISQPRVGLITVDGGYKSFATDAGAPQLRDVPGAKYRFGGDEHGIILLADAERPISLGERLWAFTPHCDPTVNLYDWLYPVRDGLIHEVWPIAARGCSW
jgi:3-hydroxy-D-aspartate aldolase